MHFYRHIFTDFTIGAHILQILQGKKIQPCHECQHDTAQQLQPGVFNDEQITPHRGHENGRGQQSVKHKPQPHHLKHWHCLNQPLGTGV